MQLLVVPINKEAERRLYSDKGKEGDYIRVFLSDESYESMWNGNLYTIINRELDVIIDCYEDEYIGKSKLKKLLSILEEHGKNINNPIVPTLYSLTQAAIRFKTGVYFFY